MGGLDAKLAQAHAQLLRDHSIQFNVDATPPSSPPPQWLVALIDTLKVLGPYLGWIFWGGLALGLAFLIWKLTAPLLRVDKGPKVASTHLTGVEDRPTALKAVRLLADADRLASEGRFGEAVRLLLHRSIDDIDERRPRAVPRSATAREISGLEALSPPARDCFSEIARVVEGFAFAGRSVDAAAFAHCREVYQTFALPQQWRAA